MKLTWIRRGLHLRHPFHIARARSNSDTDKQVLLLRIDHEGHVGWGEAAPIRYYNQTQDSNEKVFQYMADKMGQDPFALDVILDRAWSRFPQESAAIAAIDGALHDLCGKILGIPVWKWFGLDPARSPLTSFSIGIDEPEIMAQKLREAEAFPILKIKVGTDNDDEILEIVRHAAPRKIIRVDANCGWKSKNVLDRCKQLAKYGVELIEQPTSPGDHAGLPAVRSQKIGPIIADESCTGVKDVLPCAGVFDGINIKLSKCGGIRRAVEMIHIARAAGLKVMLGCMVETSVGIAAAAQLAPLVDYVDLDGHLLLADDPFHGIGGEEGRLTLSDRPGLGIIENT